MIAEFTLAGLLATFQNPTVATSKDNLRLTLETKPVAYHREDTIQFRACLKNNSSQPVRLQSDLAFGLRLWPADPAGKDVALRFIPEHLLPPPTSREKFMEEVVNLEPRHSLCIDLPQPLTEWEIGKPGNYSVVAEYSVSGGVVRNPFGVSVYGGLLTSERVQIEVVP